MPHSRSDALAATTLAARVAPWPGVGVLLELSKARLSALVLLTTLVGYMLAARGGASLGHVIGTLVGTALAAFGANALNQCIEADRDARMNRTRNRPLPSGRLSPRWAWSYAVAVAAAGPAILAALVGPIPALLAAVCELIYVFAYTPLKVRTPLNTLVGAVCGAIPPMIGWSAATGGLELGAWVLAATLFFWQIPHFLALAWLYREDYLAGGFRMLPAVDRDGRLTAGAALLYSLGLLATSLLLRPLHIVGSYYVVGAVLLGLLLVGGSLWLYVRRSRMVARRLFLASVVYLPLLLGLMVFDHMPRPGIDQAAVGAARAAIRTAVSDG